MVQYKLEGIRKCYNDKVVLDIPEFSIETGQIYTIVGPNGAGKTTLLNLLAFLDVPTDGKVLFDGGAGSVSGKDLSKFRQKVTLVMQDHLLFDSSVAENVAYGLKKRGYSHKEIDLKVNEALVLVGLNDLARQRARTLSGGESKRLAIARAMAIEPEVLILDEPTANIDQRNIESIERLILEIHKTKQTTIIWTTHNLNQARRLGHKVISLVDGKLVEAPLENIFSGELLTEQGLKYMEVAPGVKVWLGTDKQGKNHISIDPSNIILSRTRLESSARNSFQGKITKTLLERQVVKVSIYAGTEFVTFITKNSFEEMRLKLGEEVFLTFKSSSVAVL